ncbi:MAG TPA: hypothetical protein VF712_17765 [Thermoleophilaceae bacterium]|jgi:hypothetical protein
MYVLTMDQRGSRRTPDKVAEWQDSLNDSFASGLRLPFARTTGDEMQALVSDGRTLADIVLRATREDEWWVGVGLGAVERPIGETARESRGEAFVSARAAVDAAKRRSWGCAVQGDPQELAARLEDCFAMLVFIRRMRSPRGWETADLAASGLSGTEIARRLRISKQAVSQRLRAAGYAEETRGRELAISLLEGTWTPPS